MEHCKKCNGIGWIFTKSDGADNARQCECKREKSVEFLSKQSNIPNRFSGISFKYGYITNNNESQKMIKTIAQKFVTEYPANDKGLLLQGSVGLGKTTILCIIGNELIKKKNNVYYIDWNDLTRIMGSGEDAGSRDYGKISQLVNKLTSVELLLFDELGASKTSPWVQNYIYYIINKRYNNKLMTLFATNYFDTVSDNNDSLTDRVGDRIRSRLFEITKPVLIRGTDFRLNT